MGTFAGSGSTCLPARAGRWLTPIQPLGPDLRVAARYISRMKILLLLVLLIKLMFVGLQSVYKRAGSSLA
jgi:hypothetical protein